jgi:hypothetical protein
VPREREGQSPFYPKKILARSVIFVHLCSFCSRFKLGYVSLTFTSYRGRNNQPVRRADQGSLEEFPGRHQAGPMLWSWHAHLDDESRFRKSTVRLHCADVWGRCLMRFCHVIRIRDHCCIRKVCVVHGALSGVTYREQLSGNSIDESLS